MNRVRILLLSLFVFSLLLISSCKKDKPCPTCPSPPTDTTSHNFVWQKFTFGGSAGSCVLSDVAIINDTLAYAVGAIYLNDSTGQPDPQPYNLAMWDGQGWKIQKLPFYYLGQPFYSPINSIFAFNSNDIWFEAGIHWDGHQFNSKPINISFPSHVNKMWGASSNDLYIVGNSGLIAHYNGSSWTKIESGTTLDFHDISGAYNCWTKQWEILAIASNSQTTDNVLVQILPNQTARAWSTAGLAAFSTGLWFVPQQRYYVVGSGVFQKALLNSPTWNVYPQGEVTNYASSAIRGQGLNDVFVIGSFHEVAHYNGSTWYNYRNEIPFSASGALGGVAINNNTVVIAGYDGAQAVVFIGRR